MCGGGIVCLSACGHLGSWHAQAVTQLVERLGVPDGGGACVREVGPLVESAELELPCLEGRLWSWAGSSRPGQMSLSQWR